MASAKPKGLPRDGVADPPKDDAVDQFLELVARLIARRHLQQSEDSNSQKPAPDQSIPAQLETQTKKKMIAENPLAIEKTKWRKAEKVDRALTLRQVEGILAAAAEPWRSMLQVIAMGGMRAGECCHLLKNDIDLCGDWLHVTSREGAKTKTKRSRKVPIHHVLRPLLVKLAHGSGGLLFPASRAMNSASPADAGKLNKHFVGVCKKVGVPAGQAEGFTVRSLRHFFKSYCISQGVPREYIDDWQGHSRVGRPADLYVHTYDDDSQRFMRQVSFDSLLLKERN